MNEKNSYLENLVKGAIEKIKEMVDVQTIIGEPVVAPNGTVIVPVSKVSIGFGSGGSDLPTKNAKDLFGGGVGGGSDDIAGRFYRYCSRRKRKAVAAHRERSQGERCFGACSRHCGKNHLDDWQGQE